MKIFILKHIELCDANEFVARHHRHHKPVRGHRFSLSAWKENRLVGVAIAGRPVSRMIDHTNTIEVLRLCTDGEKNACSFLYAAVARAAHSLGYNKVITYILQSEQGISFRASGWRLEYKTTGGSWNTPCRPRKNHAPIEPKQRYSIEFK
jgi:hypothetical protein